MNLPLKDTLNPVATYLNTLQQRICQWLENEDDQGKFQEDHWQHPEGGGGITRVLQKGKVIEKAGVNFSHISGRALPQAATAKKSHLANLPFQAMGLSVVIHPLNPFAPTTHMNVRFITIEKSPDQFEGWFGGGFDLTPYYGFAEDARHFHQMAKEACDPFGDNVYTQFKKNCDDYFYLKHRQEPRGIGGIFFDDLSEWGFEKGFAFMQSVAEHFIHAYQPILTKRKNLPYTQHHRDFQTYRRGRYVEFNLLYDRGTLFGLQAGGRTESILMSLPPNVQWKYDWQPTPGSEEEKLYQEFLIIKKWI